MGNQVDSHKEGNIFLKAKNLNNREVEKTSASAAFIDTPIVTPASPHP